MFERALGGASLLERRALVWMCVLIGINQLGFGGVVPVLPLYAQSFGVSASAIGMAIAVYGLARFFVALPGGSLADRIGRRPTLAIGGAISLLGNLWCALAESFPEFVIARFVAGMGAGLIITIGQVVLADIAPPERRGRTMAIYQGVFLFAVGVGPFPGGVIAEHYGLAAPFFAYTVAGGLAGLVAWFMVPETRDLGTAGVTSGRGRSPSFLSQIRVLFNNLGFVLVGVMQFVNAVARTGGLFTVIPVLASVKSGLGTTQIGFGLALGSLAGLLVTYPAGVVADRFGRKAVIVPATVGAGLSFVLFCYAPSFAWYLGACLVWGMAAAVSGAAPAAYAADSAPAGMNASAISTFRMLGDFGYVLGPILLGYLVDYADAETSLITAAVALVLIGAVFAVLAPETYRAGRNLNRQGD